MESDEVDRIWEDGAETENWKRKRSLGEYEGMRKEEEP